MPTGILPDGAAANPLRKSFNTAFDESRTRLTVLQKVPLLPLP